MRDERLLQVACVERSLPQHARIFNRVAIVAKCDGAGVGEQVVRRKLDSGAIFRYRRDGVHAREPRGRGTARDLSERRR